MIKRIIVSSNPNRIRELHEMCTCREDLNDEVDQLRKKFDLDVNFLAENSDESVNAWGFHYEDETLRSEVLAVLSKLGIAKGWMEGVLLYAIDGLSSPHDDLVLNPDGLVMDINTKDYGDVVWFIGPDTTNADIKTAWKLVVDLRGGKAPRNRILPNAERDQKIFRMARYGKIITQIANEVKEEFGDDIDYGLIKKIVSSSYQKYKIPNNIRPKLDTKRNEE